MINPVIFFLILALDLLTKGLSSNCLHSFTLAMYIRVLFFSDHGAYGSDVYDGLKFIGAQICALFEEMLVPILFSLGVSRMTIHDVVEL